MNIGVLVAVLNVPLINITYCTWAAAQVRNQRTYTDSYKRSVAYSVMSHNQVESYIEIFILTH